MTTAPVIYARPPVRLPIPLFTRLAAMGIALGSLGLLVTAAILKPNPSGVGTHTGLGLAHCAFEVRTGIPCPSCGMTTSFAYFVRGQIAASLWVQPMGTALALAAAMAVWGGLYVGITGRPAHRLMRAISPGQYMMFFATLAILAWMWKIYIHVQGIDGWH